MINIFRYWHEFRVWDGHHKDLFLILLYAFTIFGALFIRMIYSDEVRREYRELDKKYSWSTGFRVLFCSVFFYVYFPIIFVWWLLKEAFKVARDFKLGKEPPSWW